MWLKQLNVEKQTQDNMNTVIQNKDIIFIMFEFLDTLP